MGATIFVWLAFETEQMSAIEWVCIQTALAGVLSEILSEHPRFDVRSSLHRG